jgi:KEOPS complex subunit Cgi121
MEVVGGTAVLESVDEFVASLGEIGEAYECVVQAFDARYVVDRTHLETAVRYAARAHERGDAIARDPAVECLLYAAGRRQIDDALEMGVAPGETPVLVVVASDFPDAPLEATDGAGAVGSTSGDTESAGSGRARGNDREARAAAAVADVLADADLAPVFDGTDVDRVCEFFDVGDAERDATDASLGALVRERVVLLSIDH